MKFDLNNKDILIIGGTGSWGQELTRQILQKYRPKNIIIYSRGEHKQVNMQRMFNNPKLRFVVGDIRDSKKLILISRQVDIIFHLAALKHVPVCEKNPVETLKTNIIGTQNAIEAAIINNVAKFILVSTDKAVDPINTYGASKLLAEKLVINANFNSARIGFSCIRAGNVIGSNGSVVPLFKKQIENSNEITITNENMTRYMMTLNEAIGLVLKAVSVCMGGEIMVTKMPSIKIIELAKVMISVLGNESTKIRTIGIRPGEKLHEVLISKYESGRTIEYDYFYVILPTLMIEKTFKKWNSYPKVVFSEYNSKKNRYLNFNEIKSLLSKGGWLEKRESPAFNDYTKEEILELFKREGWLK